MADEIKKDATINTEEQAEKKPEAPEEKAEKKPGKIKEWFGKNKKKIATGAAIAGAFAGGLIAEKIGIKFGKNKDDQTGSDSAAE